MHLYQYESVPFSKIVRNIFGQIEIMEFLEKLPFIKKGNCAFNLNNYQDTNFDFAYVAKFEMPDINNYRYQMEQFSNSMEIYGYNIFTIGYCATSNVWSLIIDNRIKEALGSDSKLVAANFDLNELSNIYHSLSELYTDYLIAKYPEKKPKVYEIRNVYVMLEEASGKYKIGISRNVAQRLKTLSYAAPTLKFIKSWKGTFKDETAVHALFEDKRLNGEWFYLEDGDIDTIENYFNSKTN